jgi:hypothetical protein
VKDKSHKGQRHKGCGLCDREKRAGNAADRRPARDRRQGAIARSEELSAAKSVGPIADHPVDAAAILPSR